MALVETKVDAIQEGVRYSWGTRTGTRSAADFTVTLGFMPKKIRVVNLTDRIEATHVVDANLGTANAESLVTVAAGTRTYAAAGISVTDDGLGFAVDVSVAPLETDNDDTLWEAWG